MFPCVYVCGPVYVCVSAYVCMYVYTCITYVYIFVCIYTYICVRVYTCGRARMHWLCRCTRTHCFCAYFRVIPFCTSSRGGQLHSLGYRLRHVRAIYFPCAFSLRLVGAKFGPSLFLFFSSLFTSLRILVALIILAVTSPGGFVLFFSCTDFTGIVSLLSS